MLEGHTLKAKLVENTSSVGALGFKGEDGLSAYEIAVKNGYQGTEQDWIDHFGLDLTNYIKTTDVINNLSSSSTTYPLSAYQGRYLKNYIDTYRTNVIGEAVDLDTTSKIVVNAINEVNSNVGNKAELTTTSKTNLVSAINEVKSNANKELDLYKGRNLVVFGDSWSQPGIANSEDEYWVKQVASALNMNRFNYAIAGAGFSRTNNKMITQLQTAISQMTAGQKNNTALVIIFAGDNDLLNGMTDENILIDAVNLISQTHTTFPNAKIIVAPFEWSFGGLTQAYNSRICSLIGRIDRETCTLPVIVLKLVRYWLYGIKSYYRNHSHPSVSGYKVIAGMFINAILGGGEHVCDGGNIEPVIGNTNNFSWNMEDGNVTILYDSSFSSALSNYSGIVGYLPAIATPGRAILSPLYVAGTGEQVGTILIDDDGTMYLKKVTISANVYTYMLPVSFKCSSIINWSS